ncbi:MAG TPA: hypothetical protein VN698_07130 [Bacteroidia bacterium]|nr:hypothetical protein [Bacteroidia bacterium]
MKTTLTFQERTKLAMELLAKQKPVTLEEAREQAKWLSSISSNKVKKKRKSE